MLPAFINNDFATPTCFLRIQTISIAPPSCSTRATNHPWKNTLTIPACYGKVRGRWAPKSSFSNTATKGNRYHRLPWPTAWPTPPVSKHSRITPTLSNNACFYKAPGDGLSSSWAAVTAACWPLGCVCCIPIWLPVPLRGRHPWEAFPTIDPRPWTEPTGSFGTV